MAEYASIDGNEAVARVAYKTNELCALYPITPASSMGEWADQWASEKRPNIWGQVPDVVQMQSEGGAAGTLHGALQAGALSTTFTASQGLLLMLPNMYKIAGELTSTVIHVAARSIACQGLSIFGDHSDVMATRASGFGMLFAASPQEAQDMALLSQAITLRARVPFLNIFDGFRTSHEINRVCLLTDEDCRALLPPALVHAHRRRALNPDHPFIRGTAQNPDVFFQAREAVNPFYAKLPETVAQLFAEFAERTGREYHSFEYHGSPSAERVVVLMGSGCETVRETLDFLNAKGENLGFVQVRLYRPFAAAEFAASLPASCRHIAVLDRTKEPGAPGEPLYQDVLAAFADTDRLDIRAIRGRYGLSSKEFTPAMVKAIFDELSAETPRRSFTIGIHDDLGHSSLDWDASFSSEAPDVYRAVFLGLGSDGTVSANKSSIKIIAGATDHHCQAYFVYDSKKAGSQTISHLRFGPQPIRSTYLIREAHFVGCHQFQFIRDGHALRYTRSGGILLINSPWDAEKTWRQLPKPVQQQMIDQELRVYLVDAAAIAREVGLGRRINTVMQACFFALADVLPREDAIAQVKAFLHKAYGHKGEKLLVSNESAIELALERMLEMPLPKTADGLLMCPDTVADSAPEFVRDVLAKMIDGRGDELPVSALPADGTYPSGTAAWEKRELTDSVPVWDSDLCVQCGNCSFVCPHACIRSIFCDSESLRAAPPDFPSASLSGRGYPNQRYSLQVYVEECTGCQLCVEVCPVSDPREPGRKAINMQDKAPVLSQAQENLRFFETLPPVERRHVDFSAVRGVQYLPPTFAFCGACAGCGETPYLRLLSQLFGDRLLIANATGCSSIYGGNLPTTPWGTGPDGRGPAWSNSLFEDNAEFGLGMRLAADHQRAVALDLLSTLGGGQAALARSIREAPQRTEADIRSQRDRVQQLITHLQGINSADARALLAVVESLVRRSVWCVGGDGWAYDIGYGGLDHVLASGRDVNILVLDTEVYSNTGGQASKATPLGAVAKFASGGKQRAKKDLALQVMAYGDVYVARVAMGANATQTLQAFREAEAYPGPSLILAYSHCIAHGIAMEKGLHQQDLAVASGCWPLCRYNPQLAEDGKRPLLLDSPSPTVPVHDYVMNEMRYRQLQLSAPQESQRLISQAQDDATRRWRQYCELAGEAVE